MSFKTGIFLNAVISQLIEAIDRMEFFISFMEAKMMLYCLIGRGLRNITKHLVKFYVNGEYTPKIG